MQIDYECFEDMNVRDVENEWCSDDKNIYITGFNWSSLVRYKNIIFGKTSFFYLMKLLGIDAAKVGNIT